MKIEVCVTSAKAIRFAKKAEVDRIELCQNLEVGGLTPTLGMILSALEIGIETHILIRPRLGGFCYSDDEFEMILKEMDSLSSLPVAGFVIGLHNANKDLEVDRLKKIKLAAQDKDLTFHRAFDDLRDWKASVDILAQNGFKRILSSGLASTVDAGLKNIPEMLDVFNGKLELMVGGGVNNKNIEKLLYMPTLDAIHFSGTQAFLDQDDSKFNLPRLELNESEALKMINKIKNY